MSKRAIEKICMQGIIILLIISVIYGIWVLAGWLVEQTPLTQESEDKTTETIQETQPTNQPEGIVGETTSRHIAEGERTSKIVLPEYNKEGNNIAGKDRGYLRGIQSMLEAMGYKTEGMELRVDRSENDIAIIIRTGEWIISGERGQYCITTTEYRKRAKPNRQEDIVLQEAGLTKRKDGDEWVWS